MKNNVILILTSAVFLIGCVSIPKQTVELSETIGTDIEILHRTHRSAIALYYANIKDNINEFVDDVYKPFFINEMMQSELRMHKNDSVSIFSYMEDVSTPENRDSLLSNMNMLNLVIEENVSGMRAQLLEPVISQEDSILSAIDQAYTNVIYGNNVLTAYLKSARKTKEAQKEALRVAGLDGFDEKFTENIINASSKINEMVEQGRKIDMKAKDFANQASSMQAIINSITKK